MNLPTLMLYGLCYACCYFNTNVQQMPSGARKAPDGRDLHFQVTFSFTDHTDALLFQKLSQNSRALQPMYFDNNHSALGLLAKALINKS